MTQFEGREEAYEDEFARKNEFDFKVLARRNKLLGLWAAAKMGLSGDKADDYAAQVIESCFEESGDEDVYRKVKGDLETNNIDISEHQLRREMEDQMEIARAEMTLELKG